jgi:nitrate/nitrite transporter NarK
MDGPPVALWPSKLLYLVLFSGLSAFSPFLTVFLEDTGLTPSQIGLCRMLLPLAGLSVQPLWTALADSRQCHRAVMLSTMIVGTLLRCGIGAVGAVVPAHLRFPCTLYVSDTFPCEHLPCFNNASLRWPQ